MPDTNPTLARIEWEGWVLEKLVGSDGEEYKLTHRETEDDSGGDLGVLDGLSEDDLVELLSVIRAWKALARPRD